LEEYLFVGLAQSVIMRACGLDLLNLGGLSH
jgi:hypothetical protein